MNLVGKIFVFPDFLYERCVHVFCSHDLRHAQKLESREVLRTEIGPRGQKIGWKKQLEDEQQKNVELQSQKKDLQGEIATQQAAKRQEIAKLEAELNEADNAE